MKVKITRHELFNLLNMFETVKDLKGIKFAYAILKNKQKIGREIEALNKSLKPDKKYSEFEKERIKLCVKHCKKDEKGKPIIEKMKYIGLDKNAKFEKEVKKLQKVYKETLDNFQKLKNEYNQAIAEEIDFEIHQIDKKDLPVDITPKQLESILLIVKE